jgi:hypothetical protein
MFGGQTSGCVGRLWEEIVPCPWSRDSLGPTFLKVASEVELELAALLESSSKEPGSTGLSCRFGEETAELSVRGDDVVRTGDLSPLVQQSLASAMVAAHTIPTRSRHEPRRASGERRQAHTGSWLRATFAEARHEVLPRHEFGVA